MKAGMIMRGALFLAPALLGLSACSTHPDLFARYETAADEDIWSEGLRLHPARAPSLEITSGFVGRAREAVRYDTTWSAPLRFTVRIRNTGDSAVLIDPTRFRIQPSGFQEPLRGMDPERVIREVERGMARQEDSHAAVEGVSALLLLPVILLSPFADRTPEQAAADRKFWEEEKERAEDAQARHDRRMTEAGSLRDAWADLSLRKTTLFPGRHVQGLVHFPDNSPIPRPDTLRLQYEVSPGRILELGHYLKIPDAPETRQTLRPANSGKSLDPAGRR